MRPQVRSTFLYRRMESAPGQFGLPAVRPPSERAAPAPLARTERGQDKRVASVEKGQDKRVASVEKAAGDRQGAAGTSRDESLQLRTNDESLQLHTNAAHTHLTAPPPAPLAQAGSAAFAASLDARVALLARETLARLAAAGLLRHVERDVPDGPAAGRAGVLCPRPVARVVSHYYLRAPCTPVALGAALTGATAEEQVKARPAAPRGALPPPPPLPPSY